MKLSQSSVLLLISLIAFAQADVTLLTSQLSYGPGLYDIVESNDTTIINGRFVYDNNQKTIQSIDYSNICDTTFPIYRNEDTGDYFCMSGSNLRKVQLDASFKPTIASNISFSNQQDFFVKQGDLIITSHTESRTLVSTVRVYNMTTDAKLHEKYIELKLLGVGSAPAIKCVKVDSNGLFFGVESQQTQDYFFMGWSETYKAQKIDSASGSGVENCYFIESIETFFQSQPKNAYDGQTSKSIKANIEVPLYAQIMDDVFVSENSAGSFKVQKVSIDNDVLVASDSAYNPIEVTIANNTGSQFYLADKKQLAVGDSEGSASYLLDLDQATIAQVGGGNYPSIYFAGLDGGSTVYMTASGYITESAQAIKSYQTLDLSTGYIEYYLDTNNDGVIFGQVFHKTQSEGESDGENAVYVFNLANSTVDLQTLPGSTDRYNTLEALENGEFSLSYSFLSDDKSTHHLVIQEGANRTEFLIPNDVQDSSVIHFFNYNQSNNSITTIATESNNYCSINIYDLSGNGPNATNATTWSVDTVRINSDIIVALDGAKDFVYVYSFAENDVIQTFDLKTVAGLSIAAVGVDMSQYPNVVGGIVYSDPKAGKANVVDSNGNIADVGYELYGYGAEPLIQEVGRNFGFKVSTPSASANFEAVYRFERASQNEDEEIVFLGITN